jgi:hypothetical protein
MSGPNTAKTFWDEIVNVGVFESTFASRPYGISWFIYAQRFLAMGNSLESVDVAEHQIRMPFVRPGVTAHNYVGPITGGTLGLQLKYHGDITSTAADENRPDYAGHHVVSDNHLHTGSNEHVAEITGSGGGQNTHIERFRFERNYMTVNGTSDSFHAGLYIGARDSLVADNIVLFNAAGTPPWMGYRCYMKSDQGSPADGIWFVNNTCAGDDNGNYPGWGAVCVHVSSYCTNSVAKNNLFYMPNMADSQTHVFREDAATDDSNNVEASSNPFVVGAGSWNDPNDLQITLNSDAEGAGVKQDMVLDDYGLRTRDPNDADVGAWAYNIVTDANAPPTVTVSTSTDPDPPEGFSPLTIDVTGTVTGGSGNIDWKLDCEDDDGTWDDTATNTDTTHDFSVDCVYTSNATLEVQATRSGVTDNDLTSVTINTPTITVTTSTDPAPAGPSPLTLTVTGTFTGTAEGDIDWKLDCKDDDATWDQEVTDANEIYTFSTTCEYTEDDTLEIQGTRLGVTDNDLTAVNITTYGDNLLTNPGAEDPNCLGWTLVGTNTANFSCATECLPQPQCPSTDPNSAVGPYSGSYVFTWAAPTATDDWARQDVDVSAYAVDIDAGDVNLKAGCYAVCGECQSGYDQYQVDVYLYDGNDVQLAQPHNGALTDEECSWTWEGVEDYNLPANTRTVRVEFQTIEPPSWAAGKVDDCEVRLDTTSPITFGISATTDPNDAAGPHPLVLTATGIVDPNTTATGNIDWKLDCEDDDGTWDDQATNTDTTHEFGTTCSYTGDAVLQVQATRAGITDNEYIDVDYLGTSPGIDWVDNGGQEDANGPTDPNLPGGFPARSVSRLYPVLSDATMRGGMYRPRQHVGREGRMSAPH